MNDPVLNPVIDDPRQNAASSAPASENASPSAPGRPLPASAIRDLCNLSRSIEEEQKEGEIISLPLLQMLLSTIKYHDEHILSHSKRVAVLSIGVGKTLGWNEAQLKTLETAALLHDVGKIGVPQHILQKPGPLSQHEMDCVSHHQNVGNYLLQACHVSPEMTEIIMQSSRTYSLFNQITNINLENLSLGARILAVVDAYDSLRNHQVYRGAKSHVETISILQEQGNSRFDLSVVGALHRWLKAEEDQLLEMMKRQQLDEAATEHPKLNELVQGRFLNNILQYLYSLDTEYNAFYLVNENLETIVWNRGMELLTGFSSRELLGQKWSPKKLKYRANNGKSLKMEDHSFLKAFEKQAIILDTVYHAEEEAGYVEYEVQSIPVLEQENDLKGIMEILDLRPQQEELTERDMKKLKLAASRDALTDLPNRGELEKQLEQHWKKFQVHPETDIFSVIFLDVDFFKSINDNHGHAVGDQVLIDLARLLEGETYSGEIVGRFGGEEFVILCPNTEMKMGIQKAKRFRIAIEKMSIGGMPAKTVTASFGVAQVEKGDQVEDVVRRADKALYQAKETGRNKVCWSSVAAEKQAQQQLKDQDHFNGNYEFQMEFVSAVNSELLFYKLKGYMHDNQVEIESSTPEEVIFNVGKSGLFSKWGKTYAKQPVRIQLNLTATGEDKQNEKSMLTVKVTPQSGKPPIEEYRKRAQMAVKHLCEYLQLSHEQNLTD